MRGFAERAWFTLSVLIGQALRSARYSDAGVVRQDGELQVRKRRRSYAVLLVPMGGPLMRILDTGVRVLPQQEWGERERLMYRSLYGTSIRIDTDGAVSLPFLRGATLAGLLEDPEVSEPWRRRAIALAAVALAGLHARGFTHGDAMAENVMVDLESEVAHWFDFETVHDPERSMIWCRTDDVRALLATCLLRTAPDDTAATLQFLLDAYGDEAVARPLADGFASALKRPLPFHLGQAALTLQGYRHIARLLRERQVEAPSRRGRDGAIRTASVLTPPPATPPSDRWSARA